MNEHLDPSELGRPACLKIFKEHLHHNVSLVHACAPHSTILAMVKANAYGHGLITIAQALDEVGVDALGVASINEALQLRKAGIQREIILMEGCFCREELVLVQAFHLTIIVHQYRQIEFLEQSATHRQIPVWLKVNIGMNRLGVLPEQVSHCYERLCRLPWVLWEGTMGHFSDSDLVSGPNTLRQVAVFSQAVGGLPGKRSLANSAGILAWPTSHLEQVRPGIMLYGISPFPQEIGADRQLKPVMEFSSALIAEQWVEPGHCVGYGSTWQVPLGSRRRIGIVAAGYGDGYPQYAPTGTPVWVAGKIVPLVGRVSMDMMAVDLSDHPRAQLGSKVVLWGSELPVEQVARHVRAIPYALLCGLAPRVPVAVVEPQGL